MRKYMNLILFKYIEKLMDYLIKASTIYGGITCVYGKTYDKTNMLRMTKNTKIRRK